MEAFIWKATEAQQELALELVINIQSVGSVTLPQMFTEPFD